MKILYEQDILCLQEVRQSKKIPGLRTKSKLRNGEKDGGVSTIFRNELRGGIEQVKCFDMEDVLIFKLKKTFFKFERDVFLINAYVAPHNSSGAKNAMDKRS